MNTIQFNSNSNHTKGTFCLEEKGERVAEMEIGINGNNLTVYHTEVNEKLKGKGIASALLTRMVEYAREHELKVIPLCPFVSAQFKKNPEKYIDLWNRDWH